MKKAVVFTVYDRINYFTRCLAAWDYVEYKESYDFYFNVDYSINIKLIVKEIIKFCKKNNIPMSHIKINNPKLGMGLNQFDSMQRLFDLGYDFVVNIEDDIVVSNDCLKFFDSHIELLNNDDKIMSIQLNSLIISEKYQNYFMKFLFEDYGDYFFPHNTLAHGWGTTKSAWEKYFVTETWNDPKLTWDVYIAYSMEKNNLKVIYPISARSTNIGEVGCNHGVNVPLPNQINPDNFDIRNYNVENFTLLKKIPESILNYYT